MSEVVEIALYDPKHGFYETGGSAGRGHGDFITSPEVGPLFGAVLARALDARWTEMGQPDPYLVVEAGAGPGTLARTILAAKPNCAPSLRYVLVERSATQRQRHAHRLPLEHPSLVLPPVDPDTEQPVAEVQTGPLCASLAELPRVPGTSVVVIANELLDNLPFDLAERTTDGWNEVRVGTEGEAFVEVLVPLDEARSALLAKLAPTVPHGARVPLQQAAEAWLQDALSTAGPKGTVVVFDYAATTTELATRPRDEWLRTYRFHGRGSTYLDDLGQQDITCEVAADQLANVRAPVSNQTQTAWLKAWGIDDLVGEGEAIWQQRAHIGDLTAIAARSRTTEAHALQDPDGLGAFHVLTFRN